MEGRGKEIASVRRRRAVRWVVVLGLAVVVALGLAVLILRLSQPSWEAVQSPAPVRLPPGLAGGTTARQAYPPAAEVAQSWQPDGRLAVVSAHWRPRQGRWPTGVAWMFHFYSSGARRFAVILVEGGRARLLREAVSPYPLPTFAEADWQVDSSTALEVWWGAGGETFQARHSEVDLTAQLRVPDRGDRPVWTVTGVAGDQVRTVVVDGTTGERVQE